MTGAWPVDGVDHRRGDPANNRWQNLRPATQIQNGGNRAINRNNTSGANGVVQIKSNGKWAARICVARKCISLGHYDAFEEAVAARQEADLLYRGDYATAVSRAAQQ